MSTQDQSNLQFLVHFSPELTIIIRLVRVLLSCIFRGKNLRFRCSSSCKVSRVVELGIRESTAMDANLVWYMSAAACLLLLLSILQGRKSSKLASALLQNSLPLPPTPPSLPLLGHLHLLRGDPFVDMTRLSEKYGEIYFLQLGTVPTVVVSSLKLMKEVLVGKGSSFGHRPSFLRYHVLFGGDKENSLAFCDWSPTQKLRRSLARKFCHSHVMGTRVEESISRGSDWLSAAIEKNRTDGSVVRHLKQDIQTACANIFFEFFASQAFDRDEDPEFATIVRYFDDIFWDINQNHPTDVLPVLAPFYSGYFKHMSFMSQSIRNFVLRRILPHHENTLDSEEPRDLVDSLLIHLNETGDEANKLTMEQVLFELEDFLGGHSAVGNLVARALVEIADTPGMSEKIYEQVVVRKSSTYMQAVLYETLRKTSSPIVPHVASEDTSVAGFLVKKGTMVLFNNFELNASSRYWDCPEKFVPERFLTSEGGFRKPSHFMPFSTGKRACMGYKLVEDVFEGIVLSVVEKFDLSNLREATFLPPACVALHPEVLLNIKFTPRAIQ